MTTKRIGALVLPACLCLSFGMTAGAQDKPAERYIYATYSQCDFSKQERYDEIFDQVQKPVLDAAMKDGTITTYSYLGAPDRRPVAPRLRSRCWQRPGAPGRAEEDRRPGRLERQEQAAGRRGQRDLPFAR